MVKNPSWQEADQLAIYKHDQGVELRTTKNNTNWWSERDLNLRPSHFKAGALTKSTMLPPIESRPQSEDCYNSSQGGGGGGKGPPSFKLAGG